MKGPRVSVKAVVVQDGRLLVIRKDRGGGPFYVLPGGGQHRGEPLDRALVREAEEETGLELRLGKLLFVRDYIAAHHEFADDTPNLHAVQLMFECQVVGGTEGTGRRPDTAQVGVTWLDLAGLEDQPLYPAALRRLITPAGPLSPPVYLGDIN